MELIKLFLCCFFHLIQNKSGTTKKSGMYTNQLLGDFYCINCMYMVKGVICITWHIQLINHFPKLFVWSFNSTNHFCGIQMKG